MPLGPVPTLRKNNIWDRSQTRIGTSHYNLLHPTVDIRRFLYRNESYVVKEGVRTTTIRQEGNKDKVIKISGLHPNTKDQVVVKYLSAHGKVRPRFLNSESPVTFGTGGGG